MNGRIGLFIWRDLRERRWLLLWLNLTVMVAIVSTIAGVTQRLDSAVVLTQSQLLGGDIQLRAADDFSEKINPLLAQLKAPPNSPAQASDVVASRSIGFTTMLYGLSSQQLDVAEGEFDDEGNTVLASLRAVDAQWPLRGEVWIQEESAAATTAATTAAAATTSIVALQEGPAPGEIWLDQRLVDILQVAVGDAIEVGSTELRFAKVLNRIPDQGSGDLMAGVLPKGLMHYADVPATQVVVPGSRSFWLLSLALQTPNQAALAQLSQQVREWEESSGFDGQIIDGEKAENASDRIMSNMRGIIGLAGALAVLLASVGVGLAAGVYASQQTQPIALLKVVGASFALILRRYLLSLALLFFLASSLGSLIAWLAQEAFAQQLLQIFETPSYAPGAGAYVTGVLLVFSALLIVAWGPMRRAMLTSPTQCFRPAPQDSTARLSLGAFVRQGLPLLLVVSGLMLWIMRNPEWLQLLLAGFALAGGVLLLVSIGLFVGIRTLTKRAGGLLRVLGSEILHYRFSHAAMTGMLALVTAPLILIWALQGTLLQQWSNLQGDRPNYFVFNLANDEAQNLVQDLVASGATVGRARHQTQMRISDVRRDGASIIDELREQAKGGRLERPFSVSSFFTLPSHSQVVEGEIWDLSQWRKEAFASDVRDDDLSLTLAINQAAVPLPNLRQASLHQEFAENYSLLMGDELLLTAGGEEVRVKITSLRDIDWAQTEPGFFAVVSPDVMQKFPTTAIFSFFAPKSWRSMLAKVARSYPTASILNIDDIVEETQRQLGRMQNLLQVISVVTMLATLIVLFQIGLYSTASKNLRSSLLRVLGSSRWAVFTMLLGEAALIGLVGWSDWWVGS